MITLDRLVNVLGGYGVRLRWSSVPRSTELRSVVVHEPPTERPVVGDVLLAIGAGSHDEAVRWAASARAIVVVLSDRDAPVTFDSDTGVGAVMVIDEAVSWSAVAAVVYGLVLEGRETESGRGPTDLFALADSLADAIGSAVVIHDRLLRVLAYSRLQQHADPARVETILGRQTPEPLRALFEARGVLAHLAVSDEPLFIAEAPDQGLTGRMVVAVRSGAELIGSVWVACPAPLDDAARGALADGAHTVALHLLRSRASADLERQVESELVIRLLEGATDASTVASRLGLAHNGLRVIAVQAFVGTDRDAALLLAFERATTGFGWSRPGRSALAGNIVYTVLPGEDAATARRWVTTLHAALPERVTVIAGISGVAELADLAAARQEADNAWHCTRCRRPPRRRPTTSRGTTSCCSGCEPRHAQGAPRPADRWPNCAATTRPTERTTCSRCERGYRPRATRPRPANAWECMRTPSVTGCAKWPSSPTCRWTTPESAWR